MSEEEQRTIEVFEWRKDAPRPDQKALHDNGCITILSIPPDGQLPQSDDVIHISDERTPPGTFPHHRYRVIAREFCWTKLSEDGPQGLDEHVAVRSYGGWARTTTLDGYSGPPYVHGCIR